MSRFWIGTSGWNYRHWRGRFYPKDVAQRRWLAFYAERFQTVEINYSFYREPAEKTWDAWREQAPAGFRFAVKAHRYLTHRKRLADPEDSLDRVMKGARRLRGNLGPVLYQLPPYFKRTPEHVDRLARFLAMLPGDVQHAVEFRDPSWFVDETLALLRRHGVAFCAFDRPGWEGPVVSTARFAYMRFHGSSHGDGNYSERELQHWADKLGQLARETAEVYAYFNNDWNAYAIDNALTLGRMLHVEGMEPAAV